MSDSLLNKGSVVLHAIVITAALAIASGSVSVSPNLSRSTLSPFQLQLGP
jgi:hypothetical protein